MKDDNTASKAKVDEGKKVLGSSRLTSFWSNEEERTVVVTMLFWEDGTVTWTKE